MAEAASRFRHRRVWSFCRWKRLSLELVLAPLYVLKATLEAPRTGDPVVFFLCVDAVSCAVQRLEKDSILSSCGAARDEGALLAPRVSPALALERAREEAPWLKLPAALKHRRAFSIRKLEHHDRVAYPYWIEHLERGRRRDFRALDGMSGRRIGPKGRASILEGFVAAMARGIPKDKNRV